MDAPVARAGQKTNCLSCGQRIQIPDSDQAKTTLATGFGMESESVSPIMMTPLQEGTPTTLITAAALLLAYGGLLLFWGCFDISVSLTAAAGSPQLGMVSSNREIAAQFIVGGIQFVIGAIMLMAGVRVFAGRPAGRLAALGALAAQLALLGGSMAFVLVASLAQRRPMFMADSAIGLIFFVKFLPYATWIAFAVPIGVLLHTPSARAVFVGEPKNAPHD